MSRGRSEGRAETSRRGVLLLIADDWSPIARCYGNAVVQMPTVDGLAERGTVFTNAFCGSPSCAASRATVLTGRHSHEHGQYGHCHGRHGFTTAEDIPTLPEVLKAHGVAAAAIGKQHVRPKWKYPWAFESWEDAPHHYADMGRDVGRFLDGVVDRPFYLHVGCGDPHRSWQGFGDELDYGSMPQTFYSPDQVVVPPFLPDLPAVREELASYYRALSRLDTAYGWMIEELRRAGRAGDTLIIVMSDHGMPFPGAKASSFDSGHHCPLIIVRPGRTRPVRCRALVNWTSIMPTVLDWLGVVPPEGTGPSLLPILDQDDPAGWDETTYSHSFHEVTMPYAYRVIRGRKYKYVLNLFPDLVMPFPTDIYRSKTWQAVEQGGLALMGRRRTMDVLRQPREKLYDLEQDPWETTNLAEQPELAGVLDEFRRKMQTWREAGADLWLHADRQDHLRTWQPINPVERLGGYPD